MTRNKLYSIVLLACTAGMIWLWFQHPTFTSGTSQDVGLCMIKHVTGIPCPSCGTTRAVLEFLDGNIITALHWNPFGFLVLMIMLISPVWILIDLLLRKDTFLRSYNRMEGQIKSRKMAIPMIILVLANWGWNIMKGL